MLAVPGQRKKPNKARPTIERFVWLRCPGASLPFTFCSGTAAAGCHGIYRILPRRILSVKLSVLADQSSLGLRRPCIERVTVVDGRDDGTAPYRCHADSIALACAPLGALGFVQPQFPGAVAPADRPDHPAVSRVAPFHYADIAERITYINSHPQEPRHIAVAHPCTSAASCRCAGQLWICRISANAYNSARKTRL